MDSIGQLQIVVTKDFVELTSNVVPNSISKDVLRDEDYPWLINCITQEYLVNVGQDFHFNMPSYVWRTNQTRGS